MEAEPLPAQAGADGPAIRIRLCDNGRGFDPSGVQRKGLVSMEGRAQAIGAQLTVRSQPGATVVELVLR
jgi:signal transduction histidine kinase